MLTYFLQVNLCWLMFYGLYWALLSRETFFKLNRIYLIIGLLCGLFLPLMANWIHQESSLIMPIDGALAPVFEYTFNFNGLATVDSPTLIPTVGTTWSWWVVIGSVYFVGVFMEIIRFLMGLYKVFSMYQIAQKEQFDGYTLVITEGVCMPFSFFNYIFIDSDLLQSADFKGIMQHEMAHVRQKHSWDIILLEVVNIVFWMSPCIYLYKKSLKNIHEYLADASALRFIPKRQYGTLLIQHAQNSKMVSFVNPFFSQLKKRIIMMTKNQSSRIALVKYTLVAPLFMVLTILFATPKNGLLAKTEDFSKQIENKIDEARLETDMGINQNHEILKPNSLQNNDTIKIMNQDSIIDPIDENTPIVQDFLKNSALYDVPPSYSYGSNSQFSSIIPQVPEKNQRYILTSYSNDLQVRLAGRTGGTISQWSFKNQTLLSIIKPALSNSAVCAIRSFSLIRKPFNKNESPRQSNNSGARFSTYTQDLITLAQNGDVYEFRNIKGRCPGDAIARDIGTMSFVIGENISEVTNNSKSQVPQPFPTLNGYRGEIDLNRFKELYELLPYEQNTFGYFEAISKNIGEIESFTVRKNDEDVISCVGSRFNNKVQDLAQNSKKGDVLRFENIIFKMNSEAKLKWNIGELVVGIKKQSVIEWSTRAEWFAKPYAPTHVLKEIPTDVELISCIINHYPKGESKSPQKVNFSGYAWTEEALLLFQKAQIGDMYEFTNIKVKRRGQTNIEDFNAIRYRLN